VGRIKIAETTGFSQVWRRPCSGLPEQGRGTYSPVQLLTGKSIIDFAVAENPRFGMIGETIVKTDLRRPAVHQSTETDEKDRRMKAPAQ
jgi:hypothetical protein